MKNPQEMAIYKSDKDTYHVAYKTDKFGVTGTKQAILCDIEKNMSQLNEDEYYEE